MICFYFDWSKIELIPDVETAWKFFHVVFFQIVNKNAPFHRFSVKGRDDLAWAKARKSCFDADWLLFRQLRNKCYFSSQEGQV